MDLALYLQDHRYVDLIELIDQLPSASRYFAAVANDEEAAAHLLELQEAHDGMAGTDEAGESWTPPIGEYNLTNQLLSYLINEVKQLRQSGQAVAGVKPRKEDPFPTPRTALDRVRDRMETDEALKIAMSFGFGPEDFN